ncbi:multiple sugar transport system permease protein [Nocardioides thalensis]|uniref:Multiple sugar transport system permease protein n=1 Tax=Nocardioides thalensis TaxID=1914755 RepID=A0A853C611_9ACTN|nr:multiple sugar transport system permease protein [Nocardioides thalensis]
MTSTAVPAAPAPAQKTSGRNTESDRLKAENRLGQKLVAPAIILMLIVTAFPMIRAIWLSIYDYSLTAPDEREIVGASNYITALSDPLFWKATGITVLYMVVTVAIELVIGFAFALVMHRVIFGRGIVRTSILIPYGIITVVSGFTWQFAFSYQNGFVNGWLPFIGDDFNWFGETTPAVIAICISEIWKTTPFMSLLLLAGLAQVSEDMIEAAKVDGATWWQRMWKVVIPNMRAAIMVAILFRALDAYRIFDNIFVMTNGAEDTQSISFLTYRQTIEQFQLGMGSALSVLLFLSVLLIAFLIIKLFRVDLAQARQEG